MALFPALGAILVWWIRRPIPESPRWLANRSRVCEAERVVAMMEAHVASEIGRALPAPRPATAPPASTASLSEIFHPPFARRTTMLLLLNVFQAIGFFGFNNWVPALMASQGASFVKSLQYSFFVATLFPVASLSCLLIADRIERKWQVMLAASSAAVVSDAHAGASHRFRLFFQPALHGVQQLPCRILSGKVWIGWGLHLSSVRIPRSGAFRGYSGPTYSWACTGGDCEIRCAGRGGLGWWSEHPSRVFIRSEIESNPNEDR
jgi:hypothetical protein